MRQLGAVALALGLTATMTTPAAAVSDVMAPLDRTSETTVQYRPVPEEMCQAMRQVDADSDCMEAVETTVAQYRPARATRAVDSLDATYCRTFAQTRKNRNGPTMWSFTHRGRYCYDGRTVRSEWHSCSETTGFVFSVQHTGCSDYGQHANQKRVFFNTARVSFVAQGVPMHTTYRQWASAYASGNIYYHTEYP